MRTAGMLIENLKNGKELPFRHENPYLSEALNFTKELFTQSQIPDLIENRLLQSNTPLVLEIGCYHGKSVEELARVNPKLEVLGIDITYKRVVKTARRIRGSQLANASTLLSSAEELFPLLPAKSLSGVCVFFPNPWPKKKHQKNRLLQLEFLQTLCGKLKTQGFFWFKTDSLEYFDFVQENLLSTEFLKCQERVPSELGESQYQTAFEQLFETKKEATYSLVVRANNECEHSSVLG